MQKPNRGKEINNCPVNLELNSSSKLIDKLLSDFTPKDTQSTDAVPYVNVSFLYINLFSHSLPHTECENNCMGYFKR